MTNEETEQVIRPWANPEERVTVRFLDAPDLNATVIGDTDQLVDRSIETHVPYMTQDMSVPLSQVEVAKDCSHDTQTPTTPSARTIDTGHLINEKRPPVIYSLGRERDPLCSWQKDNDQGLLKA